MSQFTIELEDADYEALLSTELRDQMYKSLQDNRVEFQNPLYKVPKATVSRKGNKDKENNLRLKDFLVSISSFSDFSEAQLLTLEQKAVIKRYEPNDVVFKQGEDGDNFYFTSLINKTPDLFIYFKNLEGHYRLPAN